MKIASLDAAHYVVQLVRPSAYRPEGDTIYDYTLDPLPHFLQVLTISVYIMVLIYSSVDIMYQLLVLIGQLVFEQSLAQSRSTEEKDDTPFSTTFWFATGKKGSGMVRLRHGRLTCLGAYAPRDDLEPRSQAGASRYGGLSHYGRRHDM